MNCGDPNHLNRECPKPVTCRNCGKEGHIQRDCRQPQKLSPDKMGRWKGKGKLRSVDDGGEPEEEATGEAIAHETSETFMMMRSGSGTSGTESTSVVAEKPPIHHTNTVNFYRLRPTVLSYTRRSHPHPPSAFRHLDGKPHLALHYMHCVTLRQSSSLSPAWKNSSTH